jgi:prephenate dehydrogenase
VFDANPDVYENVAPIVENNFLACMLILPNDHDHILEATQHVLYYFLYAASNALHIEVPHCQHLVGDFLKFSKS